jgi:hypothetical protein
VKLLRRQEALEVAGSSGGGKKLWRTSKALEAVKGSRGRMVWRRSKALEAVEGCGGG